MSNHLHHYNHPSFSSTLLEEIYRSFDDNEFDTRSRCHSDSGYARRTKMAKTNYNNTSYRHLNNPPIIDRDVYVDDAEDYKYVLHQWMEREKEKEKEKVKIRRNSMPDHAKFRHPLSLISSSSTSSSGSSSSTTSDTDSLYGTTKPPMKAKQNIPSLKPIRTGASSPEFRRKSYSDEARKKCGKKEGKLQLQQRALKLYGDLKKVKQPISPGGKLASFLNSLFHPNNNNGKKQRRMDNDGMKVPAVPTTPSTASSYSRSCLSKTPSSAGRFERRSVRFCPVTEVYNDGLNKMEDSTTATTTLASDEEFKVEIMEKHRRVEEAAKELLKNYHHHHNDNNNSQYRKELKVNVVRDHNNDINGNNFGFEDEEEEDDDESCCSSDLFELDNLMEIGVDVDRYRQELPVYETTHLATNRAIANSFML